MNKISTRRRTLVLALLTTFGLTLLLTGTASADFLTPEDGGSPNADKIDDLYKIVLVIAVIIFVVVEGALLYSIWKYRAKKGAVAAQIHGNTRLEIGWTAGAALILVVLAGVTFAMLGDIRNPPNSGPNGLELASGVQTASVSKRLPPNGKSLNIEVNGQQYVWRYTYNGDGDGNTLNDPFSYEEMVVPVDTTVTLDIRAQDVAHSWWIPALGGKFDAVPGYTNHTWFKIPASKAGQVFTGQCAELCGRNHANMTARVRAVTPAEFEQWVQQQQAATEEANKAAQTKRREVEGQLGGIEDDGATAEENADADEAAEATTTETP